MFIHWFPGHMTKAIRMMSEEIKVVDCVIYVLDARAPESCINPAFDEVIGVKPRLYVLNKADMVSQKEVIKWVDKFRRQGYRCIYSNSISKSDAPVIVKNLLELNEDLIERYQQKGVNKTIRAMVIGVPNCGKSTLINSLVKEKKAVTGNKPGVTRGKQWVSIGEYIELLDSPGVLYPDFKDQEKAMRLALIGSVKEDVVDVSELALEAIKYFLAEHPEELVNRYKLSDVNGKSPLEVMEEIGKKRGVVMRGGELDYERIAKIIISDFRKGYLGKYPLEKVNV
ncbi:MAG: ribosome biogenesis GTPase YlqF [Clostridia bacterium]|nr:ribosome biogenesis GTPase YlqF [Clostridia bacterium]